MGIDNLHKFLGPINHRSLFERRTKEMICFGGVLREYMNLVTFITANLLTRARNLLLWSRVSNLVRHCFLVTIVQRPLSYIRTIHMRYKLGQQVSGFDAGRWNQGRDKLMKSLILVKVSQSASLKKTPRDTDIMHLAEATKGDDIMA